MPSHVLIVDDNTDAAELFQYYFESLGYRVSTASHGIAALEIEARDPADLVITDLAMPLMGGHELIARLHEQRPALPVIVVSGYLSDGPFPQGPVSVFPKPVSLTVLQQRALEMLRTVGPGDGNAAPASKP